MRKLATIIAGLACLSAMKQPTKKEPQVVNNYYIRNTKTCCGHCASEKK